MKTAEVINIIVNNDLCTGCGVCTYACPVSALEMKWNEFGFLIPVQQNNCDSNGACLQVCPFNPFPENIIKTENEIAELFLKETKTSHPKVGKHNNIHVGFSKKYRLTSSSGGMATYVLTQLLQRGIVNHVLSVKESKKDGFQYEYAVNSHINEVESASKTKYYPVSLAGILKELDKLEGKVAIVGVGCFIKAIRLLQYQQPALKEKIVFLVGIICGGIKSRFFTEYLAEKSGVKFNKLKKPQFRVKDISSKAIDYSFECINNDDNKSYKIKMQQVGDMWGTGLFKANACDFCDDVTTELADISLGDAWIEPYINDGKGTNIIITRSKLADIIIGDGINAGELEIQELTIEKLLISQQGSFNHRHLGLSTRIKLSKKNHRLVPPKRFYNEKITFDFKIVQMLRMIIRKKSLEIWKKTKDPEKFDKKMSFYLTLLKNATRINHHLKRIRQKFNSI